MAGETWTIKRCLDWTRGYLERKGDDKARLAAEWLLTAATGLSRIELYMSFDRPLSPAELEKLHAMIERRASGEPLQYVTGETSFRQIDVACAPGVLIPRPETELLVEEVLAFLDDEVLGHEDLPRERTVIPWNEEVEEKRAEEKRAREETASEAAAPEPRYPEAEVFGASGTQESDEVASLEAFDAENASDQCAGESEAQDGGVAAGPARARVLDVGCGTGCIGLSLAAERPGRVAVLAIDIAPEACALTKKNRDALSLAGSVAIRQGDLLDPVRPAEEGTFDVLVSNPPYIPQDVLAKLPREVADFEPSLALDGGPDGLDVYRRLLKGAARVLRPGGLLACELHETTLDDAALLAQEAGFVQVRIVRDLTNRPRFVLAQTPEGANGRL